jgi:hypothetical protein
MVRLLTIPASRPKGTREPKMLTVRTWPRKAVRVGGVVFYGVGREEGAIGCSLWAAFDREKEHRPDHPHEKPGHTCVRRGISLETLLAELNWRVAKEPDARLVPHPTYVADESAAERDAA